MKSAIEPNPDDPCGCSSGLPYGQCHKPIFDAPEGEMLTVAHRQYANAWSVNADHYRALGLYQAQAEELAGRGQILKLLDVGCGRGHGLEALRHTLPSHATLLGIDENPDCLAAASELLGPETVSENFGRMIDDVLPGGRYRSTYRAGELEANKRTILVQSNLLAEDRELARVLDSTGPLDAITLWFVGIHKASSATEIAATYKVRGDADYRELIEDASLELAKTRLRQGGWLQTALRANFLSKAHAEAVTRDTYSEWVADAGFVFDSVVARPYSEPPTYRAAVNVTSKSKHVAQLPGFAVSMLLRKMS